jgi:hypothetical protein
MAWRGHVALNNRGTRVHAHDEPFLVEWQDGESEYLTLEQFGEEGVAPRQGRPAVGTLGRPARCTW